MKDNELAAMRTLATSEATLKRQLENALLDVQERDIRLEAFSNEGKTLAAKQGEMEKNYRKMTKTLKEKEAEIFKLIEGRDAAAKTIEGLQVEIKRMGTESSNTAKSLSALQAVSNSSSDRLRRVESDLCSRNDEVAAQKQALELSWAEIVALKRQLADAVAEKESILKQKIDDENRIVGIGDLRKQFEEREAVLRVTSQQLQESLQLQMQESNAREERLRAEAKDMRRRWQEAVTSREALAAESSEAATPLLRQISSLRESLRTKTEQWRSRESALNERVLRAESSFEKMEQRRQSLEEQVESYKETIASMRAIQSGLQVSLTAAEEEVAAGFRTISDLRDKIKEMEGKLTGEMAAKLSLLSEFRDQKSRHRLEIQDLQDMLASRAQESDALVAQLRKDLSGAKVHLHSIPHPVARPERSLIDRESITGGKALLAVSNELDLKRIDYREQWSYCL